MIEVVIVVLVISVLAAAGAPAFLDSLLFHRVELAARRVKSDLELARHMARLNSAQQALDFSGTVYTVTGAKSLDSPNADYQVDLAAAPFELDGVEVDFDGSSLVKFDGHGMPHHGGTIVLEAKGHRCTLTVDAATGEVTIASNHTRNRTAAIATP